MMELVLGVSVGVPLSCGIANIQILSKTIILATCIILYVQLYYVCNSHSVMLAAML